MSSHGSQKWIGTTRLRSFYPYLVGTDSGATLGADKLEPVCTVGLSVPVWDRSRKDPLSCAQGLKLFLYFSDLSQNTFIRFSLIKGVYSL